MLLPRPKTDLKEFLPHVMAMVQGDSRPGLPDNVAVSYIRRAAIAFARRTKVITRIEKIKFQENLSLYPLLDGDEERIVSVIGAIHNGCPIPVISFTDNVVEICYTPNECDEHFEVEYVAEPTAKACEVDSILYDEWHDAIIAKALSDLHLMPQQPWTSGQSHMLRKQDFENEVARARVKRFRKGVNNVQRVGINQRYVGSCGGLN